jgi:hypothetical protein
MVAAAGCGFTPGTNGSPIDAADPTGDGPSPIDAADGGGVDDANVDDASRPAMVIYANRDDNLYTVDIDDQDVTFVGTISDGTVTPQIDALATSDGELLGAPAAGNRLYRIDPATAAITSGPTLTPTREYYGLTIAPPGEAGPGAIIFAGTDDPDGSLYTIDPATNTATLVGSLGGGLAIAGDIAWIPGRGLYASVNGGACSNTCIATIDPSTGIATLLSQGLPFITGLSAHDGMLYGFVNSTTGPVYRIDLDTGAGTLVFSSGIGMYDSG